MAPKDVDSAPLAAPPVAETDLPPPRPRARRFARFIRFVLIALIAAIGPLAALALGLYIYLAGGRYVTTDNAYVKSAKIAVSADIEGRVSEVAVEENQIVRPGDVLFRLDEAPFRIALAQADARLQAARHDVNVLRALYRQKLASYERASSDIAYFREQFERQKDLSTKGLTPGTTFDTASRNLRDAEDQVKVSEQDLAAARAKLGGNPDLPADLHPSVLEARALRDKTALDLEHTAVRASLLGAVTNFDLQPGEYVKAGSVVFSLVGTGASWVHANYKETDLTHVRVGQPATISIDTYPGHTFRASVTGISPATGAEFALLPPQNATGNWVKVVQRLTVRLKLEQSDDAPPLRAGMSAVVEIDTGHKRELHGILAIIVEWAQDVTKGLL